MHNVEFPPLNMPTLDQCKDLILACVDLLDKYEQALMRVSKHKLCPQEIRKIAQNAIDYGNELVDEESLKC